jgi:hypothetical protein
MISGDRLVGVLLLLVACVLWFALLPKVKAPWLLRHRRALTNGSAVIVALMWVGGFDYTFGIHWLGADHRKPSSYFAALLTIAVMLVVQNAFFNRRTAPPVGDDWLLWDLRAENDEPAVSP